MKMAILKDKKSKDSSRLNIHFGKIILVLLLLFGQVLVVNRSMVEASAYPFELGEDYYYYNGLLDSTGKRHEIYIEGRANGEYFINVEIYDEENRLYERKKYGSPQGFIRGIDYEDVYTFAIVPNDDLSEIRVYFKKQSSVNSRSVTPDLFYFDFVWQNSRYVPKPGQTEDGYYKINKVLSGSSTPYNEGRGVASLLSMTGNGIVVLVIDQSNPSSEFHNAYIKGIITKSGFQSKNINLGEAFSVISSDLNYAYKNLGKNPYTYEYQYLKFDINTKYSEVIASDNPNIYYEDVLKPLYSDKTIYRVGQNVNVYNSKHNLGGSIQNIYFNWGGKGISYVSKNTNPEITTSILGGVVLEGNSYFSKVNQA
ncbi:MAG: hypothetical protein M0Q88_02665 [Bacilli bacterium]|nr:hypothetical protein [Bacilli bacterium]